MYDKKRLKNIHPANRPDLVLLKKEGGGFFSYAS
jgi:hypothetical protein